MEKELFQSLSRQIMNNCHRSDAAFAGSFSLCSLLLRLRDYYKWELGFPPWVEMNPGEVLGWIDERERYWERLDTSIQPLTIEGRVFDPYDADKINQLIEPDGFYYSAGFAAFMKPSFVLGEIIKYKKINGFRVYYLGREAARDLYSAPAQTKDDEIILRKRPFAAYFWDMMLGASQYRKRLLEFVLHQYGLTSRSHKTEPRVWSDKFSRLLDTEVEAFFWHEYGEAVDDVIPVELWREMIASHPRSRVELMARTLKDLLADTGENGRLKFIVDRKRESSLYLFVAFIDGLASRLFPEATAALGKFEDDADWDLIENTRLTVYGRIASMAVRLIELYKESNGRSKWLNERTDDEFFAPLGLAEYN